MPRFLGFVRFERDSDIGAPPALHEAMSAEIKKLSEDGTFLDGGGLFGVEDAVNFVVSKGEVTRVDGPYAEAKEVAAGWSLLSYDTKEQAEEGARRLAELHATHWPECEMVITTRQVSDVFED